MGCAPRSLPEKQALAAVGQGLLMRAYEESFGSWDQPVAQILLTREDLSDRRRYLNARQTLLTLLRWGVVPVVNENDTVTVEEIRFGDNDTLSARVAAAASADLLVLLSDVPGLFTADPRQDPTARLIPVARPADMEAAKAGRPGSPLGTGGMQTKLEAARIASRCGIPMVLAGASVPGVLAGILAGEPVGTFFPAVAGQLSGRKRWIAFGAEPRGELWVDAGAAAALVRRGKSLLPVGITRVVGRFGRGDQVRILDPAGREIARGLVNYPAGELRRIAGLAWGEARQRVDGLAYEEAVHRDNLVITLEEGEAV